MNWDPQKGKRPPRARPGYEVGYRKTPEASRFKPERSGNPKGRPRGAKTKRPEAREEPLKNFILQEAYREIDIHDGTRNNKLPMAQTVMRSLAVKAGKGEHWSQRLFAQLVSSVEAEAAAQNKEWLETMISYKIDGERELERRKRLGITAPDLIPHPDDVHIGFVNNTVEIIGPFTKEEKQCQDIIRRLRSDCWEKID